MRLYGRVALRALKLLEEDGELNPETAWEKAAACETGSEDSRKKHCPKGAFLGLCGARLIRSISSASRDANKNGDYAIDAVKHLRRDATLAGNPRRLWKLIQGAPENQNGQLDVVLALWENDKIG